MNLYLIAAAIVVVVIIGMICAATGCFGAFLELLFEILGAIL